MTLAPALTRSPLLYETDAWRQVEADVAAVPPRTFTAEGAGLFASHFGPDDNPWKFARPDLLLADLGIDGAQLPGWVLGGRRPGHSSIFGEASASARAQVVAEATETLLADGARTLLAPYVADPRDAEAFIAAGFAAVPSHSRYELDVPEGDFDAYLAERPSLARRNIRKERRRLAAAETVVTVVPLPEADLDELVDLEIGGYQRYGTRYGVEEAYRLHVAVRDRMPQDAHAVQVRDQRGRLLSFAVLVVAGERGYLRQGAVDHDLAGDLPAYFESAFYTPMEFAQAHGLRVLDLSISSGQAKHLRGCREVTTTAFHRSAR